MSFMANGERYADGIATKIRFRLDSGCSDHMVGDKTIFSFLRKLNDSVEIVFAKKGHPMLAVLIGDINAL